jgi:glycosyltransferase involved in cell wall biosynthesis
MRKAVIAGPFATQSGYGHHVREIIENFIEQKGKEWDIKLVSLPWGGTPMTFPVSEDWQRRTIGLPLQEQPDIWVQVSVPNELQAVGKYNIGVTAGTEGDLCPEAWLDNLNAMQMVIVPSEFTKKVFEDSARHYKKSLMNNIQVIPEYFNESIYNNKNITATVSEIDEIPESFVFLCVGHWLSGQIGEDRKNIGGLIHRFFEAYKNKKDQPALLLKSSGATYSVMDRMDIENKILQIRDMFPNYRLPNVYLLHGDLTDAEMNALYNHRKVKAFLSFTKAEGFGRPLLEFATTGKPIIAPHYSGQADFLKSEFICALPGGLTPIHETAKNDWLIAEAKWFTVDYGYAGKMMQEVQTNYKKWLELAKRQRFFVNSTFTADAVAPIYKKALDIVSETVDKLPQAVELKLPQLKKIELPTLKKI